MKLKICRSLLHGYGDWWFEEVDSSTGGWWFNNSTAVKILRRTFTDTWGWWRK